MEVFDDYLKMIDDTTQRERTEAVLSWIHKMYPQLEMKIAYNQPMFTDHKTFIIGFSTSKKHLALAPEKQAIQHLSKTITDAGYEHSSHLIRFPWNKDIDYDLIAKVIDYNISDKANTHTFWR